MLDLCHFDAEQAFVQSTLDEELYLRLPQGCGALSGKVVKLARSLYGLKQASRTWHNHLVRAMRCLGFEHCAADACVMRSVENGTVSMVVVVPLEDIFSVGRKNRCDQFGRDLNQYVPIANLGELRLYADCLFFVISMRGRSRFHNRLLQKPWWRSLVLLVTRKPLLW